MRPNLVFKRVHWELFFLVLACLLLNLWAVSSHAQAVSAGAAKPENSIRLTFVQLLVGDPYQQLNAIARIEKECNQALRPWHSKLWR